MRAESIIAAVIMVLLLGCLTVAGILGYRYKSATDRAITAEQQVASQRVVIERQQQQQQLIDILAIKAAADNQQSQANSEDKVIEYRTVLRREKTCDYPVPSTVANGLLDYTNRLRASAMRQVGSQSNSTHNTATATRQLTYCQAVLWINPLLAAIEQANTQLSAIRQVEQQR